MYNVDASLAAIRAALDPIATGSTEQEMNTATDAATVELRKVAAGVAEFANALDDGTGFFNSSTEFGRQLAAEFDDVRRVSTVMGLLDALSVDETLRAVEFAILKLHLRTGPHSIQRPFLSEEHRKSLERIRDTTAATLLDSSMPSDPEDDE